MSLTADEIRLVVAELQVLLGARIRRIHQQDRHTLLLRTRGPILCLSCHPRASRLLLMHQLPERVPAQDFCMLCRKRLEGRAVSAVTQPAGDRCARISFSGEPELCLVAELTGRHANLLLLEGETILGSLLPNRSRRRLLAPGHPYEGLLPAPPRQEAPSRIGSSPSAEVSALYDPLLEQWSLERIRADLAGSLRRKLRSRQKLLRRLCEDLAGHRLALGARRAGDLLLAQLTRVAPGRSSVTLPDLFFEGEGEPPLVEIALDPRLGPAQNAERHYRRASRARRGIEALGRRIPEVESEISRLEEGLATVAAAAPELLRSLAETLPASSEPSRRPRAPRREPFFRFESSAGEAIWVGRSAQDNHRLTFSMARGRDLWLHAKDVPGSHVILRLDRAQDPPQESLLDAASLAKLYSDARQERWADISWTRRKHLRPGHSPGQVYLGQAHTLRVGREEERLRRLLQGRSHAERLLALLEPLSRQN